MWLPLFRGTLMVCVQASLDVEGGAGVGASLGGFLLGGSAGCCGGAGSPGAAAGSLGATLLSCYLTAEVFAVTAVPAEMGFLSAASAHVIILDPPPALVSGCCEQGCLHLWWAESCWGSGPSSCWLFLLPRHLAAGWPPGAVQEINGTGRLARGLQQGAGSRAQ